MTTTENNNLTILIDKYCMLSDKDDEMRNAYYLLNGAIEFLFKYVHKYNRIINFYDYEMWSTYDVLHKVLLYGLEKIRETRKDIWDKQKNIHKIIYEG